MRANREALELACHEKRADDAIYWKVRIYDNVTFAEFNRMLKPIIPVKGDHAIQLGDRNIVLWAGMSKEYFEAVRMAAERYEMYLHPTVSLTYFVDGVVPNLPVAKRAAYKSPHWLPVCFRLTPWRPKRGSKLAREGYVASRFRITAGQEALGA